ncbi:tyrosine--tRNA ligase [Enterobacteriaceae endosymbiont of Neohaemonia nigricornis]|uniref:tyrosine--tRNA ligase n=1 Tax=Enterobacteriaceae endosymbiont of Neohaemonia nigricornis TaxID=2675792 RepID=UPI00144938E7|nr:tyrosine--tRNA ligase [Enterobacteriaceae endosymbiont of Neohaemonia nigricornis]QJC30312.1 tyrosine--tRNA ligase [Enterobacteriaceae endosymbiont of Neohaemonia nigricornis]
MCNKKNNIIDILEQRDILYQITDKTNLYKLLLYNNINLYCGFDLTADSLHIGHLIPIITLKYFQKLGHKPYIILGGATSLIGDPSFKSKEREFNSLDLINQWYKNIYSQLYNFLEFNKNYNSAVIINNYDWFNKINILFFLKNIGKYFYINQMMHKDAIRNRCTNNYNINGISFTEFSYNLLQAYDFLHLKKQFNVVLQIGGSDQWGNIISGIDLIKKIYKDKVYGLTTNLILKSDGTKFGKTEKKTIWLDKKKTTPYTFFQFWLNISDDIVYNFLTMFTDIDKKLIRNMKYDNKNSLKTNSAQYLLAEYMTKMIHGESELILTKKITNLLFNKKFESLSKDDFNFLIKNNIQHIILENHTYDIKKILILSNFVSSYNKAINLIQSNSIYINNKIINDINFMLNKNIHVKFNHFILLKKGKKNFCLIYWK